MADLIDELEKLGDLDELNEKLSSSRTNLEEIPELLEKLGDLGELNERLSNIRAAL